MVEEAVDGEEAVEKIRRALFDLVILDMRMPRKDGLTALREIKRLQPNVIVLVITAFGTRQTAHQVISEGAYDYFTKPFEIQEIRIIVRRALEKVALLRQLDELRGRLERDAEFENLIGVCPAMREIFQLVDRVAQNDVTVMIWGESGTGKELIATAIHNRSARKAGELVKVNCIAIPENLLESELFGHERGAFTGAIQQKIGRIEQAHGGTLFLDEIGDMPLSLQGKLLRFLQEREFQRVGGTKTLKADVRVICATNKDLQRAVEEQAFREDLFFRINVLPIYLPPLRRRQEDIPLLIDHFIRLYNRRLGKQIQAVTSEALDLMLRYSWPGTVRELENTIQRAMILTNSDALTSECLSMSLRGQTTPTPATTPPPVKGADIATNSAEESLASFLDEDDFSTPLADKVQRIVDKSEKRLIQAALRQTGGHRQKTADLLGISRKSLHNKMVKFGLFEGDSISDAD